MKFAKSSIVGRFHKISAVRFVDPKRSNLTSFSGLVLYQKVFKDMNLETRLRECFGNEVMVPMYGFHRLFLWLVILHFLARKSWTVSMTRLSHLMRRTWTEAVPKLMRRQSLKPVAFK